MNSPQQPLMPAGTAAAIATAQMSYAHSAAHAGAGANHHFRNAALLDLADRLLGELSQAIISALGVTTVARRVLISAAQQRHAIARRQLCTQLDADLVAARLAEALENLRFVLIPQRDPRIFEVIGYAPSADRCILLPLKLVGAGSAKTKQDEWWVQTAIPFGVSKYRTRRARGELRTLQVGSLPANFAD